MNFPEKQKIVIVTPPAAIVDNASLPTASIDSKGWDKLDIYVILGATDIAMTALKVQESDTDGSYADVTNGNFATGLLPDGTAATLPSATSDNTVFAWHKDLRKGGHKRFLDVVATFGDGTVGGFAVIIAILSRGSTSPATAAQRGLAQELNC